MMSMILSLRAAVARIAAVAMLAGVFLAGSAPARSAESPEASSPALEETRRLLQQSLTIHEIDQEVARLAERERQGYEQLETMRLGIEEQNARVAETRHRAGEVIRAYYLGERQPFWLLVLSAKTLSELLTVFEFMTFVLDNDQRAIATYAAARRELEQRHERLAGTQAELAELKAAFLQQRERLERLQAELDAQLAMAPQGESLRAEITALTAEWQETGLPLFRSYFQALSEAINKLPELLTQNNHLTSQGFNYTFQITDQELNEFLWKQNELFRGFGFEFTTDQVIAKGSKDGTAIEIKGRYVLEEQPNAIRFRIDELSYNGYLLPETTARELERDYELAIYPQSFAAFFLATGVRMEEGRMAVTMKFDFNQQAQ